MQNPFTLTFGKSPLEPVERPLQTMEIVDTFTAETVNQQMFIITGVRGSGKTVMMTEIARRLREREDWVVIELNPATDLLQGMLAKLNSNKVCAAIIKSAKIDLSFFGFSDRGCSATHGYGDGDHYYFGKTEKAGQETIDYNRRSYK